MGGALELQLTTAQLALGTLGRVVWGGGIRAAVGRDGLVAAGVDVGGGVPGAAFEDGFQLAAGVVVCGGAQVAREVAAEVRVACPSVTGEGLHHGG